MLVSIPRVELMATVVFEGIGTAVGGALGGPLGAQVGGLIGSAVGSYIDGQIISALNPPEPPNPDQLKITASTYGRPIPIILGAENRMGGNIIWASDLQEESSPGKGAPANEGYTYSRSIAVALGKGEITRVVKCWANSKLIFDEDAPGPALPPYSGLGWILTKALERQAVFDSIAVYPGTFTQLPDPTIEADKGVGMTPAYRGIAYVVIKNLQLGDYGNHLPNLEFLVEARTDETTGTAVRRIVVECGLNPDQVSTAQLTDPVRGYVIGTYANGIGAIQPLALAYFFDVCEVWGSLRMQPRGTSLMGFIPDGDLGAHDPEEMPREKIRWPRVSETQMPHMAHFGFLDPARDYQENTQQSQRLSGNAEANVAFSAPLVLDVDKGKQVTDKLLWEAWTSQQKAETGFTDRWICLEPGRAYLIGNARQRDRVKVIRKVRGVNGVNLVDLRRDRKESYQSTAAGTPAVVPPNVLSLPGDTTFQLMDIPILREADDDAGFYWELSGELPGWRGGTMWRSLDDAEFAVMAQEGDEAVMGTISGTPPAGPTHIWDYATVITVTLDVSSDELSSVTPEQALAGANICWIGNSDGHEGELLVFQTATMVGPGVYELTNLLRGVMGTEYAVGLHGAAERFVLIRSKALGRNDFGSGDWNKDRYYKATSVFQELADAPASIAFQNTGEGKRPYSVCHVSGERDGSNNLTVRFQRRTRIPAPGLGNGPAPIGEASLAFEADVFDGADIVRTLTSSTEEFSYSAAEQTADGLTPGDPVDLDIYQISDVRGRGHAKAATV